MPGEVLVSEVLKTVFDGGGIGWRMISEKIHYQGFVNERIV